MKTNEKRIASMNNKYRQRKYVDAMRKKGFVRKQLWIYRDDIAKLESFVKGLGYGTDQYNDERRGDGEAD